MYQRKLKRPNWLEILDSSHCLRKYICKRPRPGKSEGLTCSQPSRRSNKSNKSATRRKLKLNVCWQLASDPAFRQEKLKAKSKNNQKPKLEHKPKDELEFKPELDREAKPSDELEPISRDELEPKPTDDLELELENEEEPFTQAEQESSEEDKQAKKKVPKRQYSTYRKQSPRRPMDFSNIIFLDARTMPWDSPKARTSQNGDSFSKTKRKQGLHPRLKVTGRSKRIYGIPLCGRPSLIMGMVYPPSKQVQQRREQLYKHPEYQDQYSRMLQSQLDQTETSHQQVTIDGMSMSLQLPPGTEPYIVPSREMFRRVRKGQRYCGNFYYK